MSIIPFDKEGRLKYGLNYRELRELWFNELWLNEFRLNHKYYIIFEKGASQNSYFENMVKEMYKLLDDLRKEKEISMKEWKLTNKIRRIFHSIILKYVKEYCSTSHRIINLDEKDCIIPRPIINLDEELKKIILSSSIYSVLYINSDINNFTHVNISSILFNLFHISKKNYYIYNYFKYLQLVLIKKNICKYIVLNYVLPYLDLNNCDNLILKFKKFNLISDLYHIQM